MASKSVSINTNERGNIIDQIKKQYAKLALLKHPNPNFHKDLSKTIYKQYVDNVAEKFTEETAPYIYYRSIDRFAEAISELKLSNVRIQTLDVEMRFSNDLLASTTRLKAFESSEVMLPKVFANKVKMVPFPFMVWGQSKYNMDEIVLEQDVIDTIDEYNTKMTEVYSELSTQMDSLISAINSCKSTKMFEDKLPNLVSLYPVSVHDKLRKKNESMNTEVTPEQQKLLDATASLAAAALLEDKK